jgi:hypothetical protein
LQVVDLVKEFTEIAEVIAQIIVDELHCPIAEKLIPPTQLGGMAGGEKYLSHGILFKYAIDSRGLYNGDEFAMKATQVPIIIQSRTPLPCLILAPHKLIALLVVWPYSTRSRGLRRTSTIRSTRTSPTPCTSPSCPSSVRTNTIPSSCSLSSSPSFNVDY